MEAVDLLIQHGEPLFPAASDTIAQMGVEAPGRSGKRQQLE
jgi:hypothetical protein